MPVGLSPSSYGREAYLYIQKFIQAGRFAPGQRLPELELAKILKVSRTPVREALLSLAADGIVEAEHGVGFVVRRLSKGQLRESFELRGVIEGYAARRAAVRITEEQLWDIEQQILTSERLNKDDSPDPAELVRLAAANLRVHELIALASGNEYVWRTVMGLSVRPLVYRASYWYTHEDRCHSDGIHRRILEALRDRHAALAGDLLIEHTGVIADLVIQSISAHPDLLAADSDKEWLPGPELVGSAR